MPRRGRSSCSSPARAGSTPRCAHFGVCGGCAWQDLDYPEQLRHKHAQVVDALERIGGFTGVEPEPMVAAQELYGYRNKVEYSWSQGPDGPSLGFHQLGRWDRLIAVDHCHIVSDIANDVRRAFERWAREQGLEAHNQRSGGGWLRHLVVREGAATGELLAMLVTAPGDVPRRRPAGRAAARGRRRRRARRQRGSGRGHRRPRALRPDRPRLVLASASAASTSRSARARSCRPTP